MKTPFTLLFFCIVICTENIAQQLPTNSFYQMNWQTINPATLDRAFYTKFWAEMPISIVTASYRQQWIGFKEAPSNAFLSYERIINDDDPRYGNFSKWGFNVFRNSVGAFSTYGIHGNYNYRFHIGEGQMLQIGFSPGIIRTQIGEISTSYVSSPGSTLTNTDTWLQSRQGQSRLIFDLSAGIFYCNKSNDDRQIFCGLSIPQLADIGLSDTSRNNKSISTNLRKPQINLLAGMFIDPLGDYEEWVLLEPSILVKYTPRIQQGTLLKQIPLAIDFNFRSYFSLEKFISSSIQNFWLGAGYGSNANLNIELGVTKAFSDTRTNTEGRFVRLGILYGVPLGNRYNNFGQTIEALLAVSLE